MSTTPIPTFDTPSGTPQSEQPPNPTRPQKSKQKQGPKKPQAKQGASQGGGAPGPGKLRGHPRDDPETRLSKTLSWLLRHGAEKEGVPMREDGFVNVKILLAYKKFAAEGLTLAGLKRIVEGDGKKRYTLVREPPLVEEVPKEGAAIAVAAGDTSSQQIDAEAQGGLELWWIRANQGHSMKEVKVDMTPILSAADVPMVVHGTNKAAWQVISKGGLSKMNRNHIHFAQAIGEGVISGMRKSSQVLIYIDLSKALQAGLKFVLSANGVVLSAGDERGFIGVEFFDRVEDAKGNEIVGWR